MQPKFYETRSSILLAPGMRFAFVLLIATAGTLLVPMATNAATITRTYEGTASGFVDGTLIAPYSTVEFAFTVTFDPLISTGTASGSAIAVDAYTGTLAQPGFGPWFYLYNAGTGVMNVGDNCPSTCTVSAIDAIFIFNLTDPDNPLFTSMTLRVMGTRPLGGSDLGTFSATVRTINGTTTTPVPGPGTLALLGLGLAGLGPSLRRKAS